MAKRIAGYEHPENQVNETPEQIEGRRRVVVSRTQSNSMQVDNQDTFQRASSSASNSAQPPTLRQLSNDIDIANQQGAEAIKKKLKEIDPHINPDNLKGKDPDELASLHKSLEESRRILAEQHGIPLPALFSSEVRHAAELVKVLETALEIQIVARQKAREGQVDDFLNKLLSEGWFSEGWDIDVLKRNIDVFKRDILDSNRLNLRLTGIRSLPPEIGNLTWLTALILSDTALTSLPPEIWDLNSLTVLDLGNTGLTSLPAEIGNLNSLTDLDLNDTAIASLPAEIGNLNSLTSLGLGRTSLTSLPSEIGNLNSLTVLDLSQTRLTNLPAETRNLRNLTLLNLGSSPISAQGENERTLGRRELRAHFGDRVVLDNLTQAPPMPASTTRDEVYGKLDQQPVRINRAVFKAATLPEIPSKAIENGQDFMQEFGRLFRNLNLGDEKAPGYLSYELLAGHYASDAQGNTGSNADKVASHLLPRLTGYFHQLYGMPLQQGETGGWQMYDEQRPAMKKALTYIINRLNEIPDADQRAIVFQQLVDGMLHCPTGQKEGIDTVVKALLEGQTARSTNLPAQIQDLIAMKKNSAFKTAVLTKAAENTQNVHLISHYEDQLKNELGLTNVLGYTERMGTFGQDPFNNNSANVIKTYYDLVTPQRLTDWIMEKTPSKEDRLQRQKLQELEKKQSEATRPQSQANPALVNRLARLKAQVDGPETTEDERASLKSQITNLESLIGRAGPKVGPELTKEQLTALSAEILQLRAQIRASDQFKPISPQKIVEHLIDGKLVNPQGDTNWWKTYFSADPTEDPGATLTRDGAGKILQQLGYVIS